MTQTEFIEAIAQACLKYCTQYGIKVVSPIIAQACLESSYGTSNKAKYHNYFGLKYRANRLTCNKGTFTDSSKEQNKNGTYTDIVTQWYSFADLDSGVEGYFQFTNISTYSNLKGVTDPHKYLELLKSDGYATSLQYVTNVYNLLQSKGLTKYDALIGKDIQGGVSMGYTNSSLVTCTVKSPNHSGKRTHSIDRITPHCVVGQLTASSIGGCFTSSSRQASCNYGIGTKGDVVLCVDEANRSWCSSSNDNDQRAITIECASDSSAPYAMNDKVYNKLVELCVDICKRNGKKKLLWLADKTKTLSYSPKSDEMVLTVHRWFANKSCPGDWLYNRLGELATTVTNKLGGSTTSNSSSGSSSSKTNTASNTSFPAVPFSVQVLVSDLNIRKGAGMSHSVTGKYTGKGTFTIIEVKDSWGKLKSGAGWIYLGNSKYVTIGKSTASSSSSAASNSTSYKVKITASSLNVRKGAGTSYGIATTVKKGQVYTIVATNGNWGKLKSGAGWICLDYTEKV